MHRPWGKIRNEVPLLYQSNDSVNEEIQNRRSFLARSALSLSSIICGAFPANIANGRGLVRFPCKEPLLNTYHFLRAGASLLELEDVWSTNPLFLTNREAALSEFGEEQVREACRFLISSGSTPTVVRYSLAAACIDSANIIGEELRVGRDRLVPEFNYMDPRAIGGWDFAALNATEEAVWALDVEEAGPNGKGGKPPPNDDGTPAETLADVVVRLTNLMSVLETLYSGDTVLLVFPDGTGPALLSCLIAGIPLNRVHELQFSSGEIRCDVNYNSINSIASQPPSQAYADILQRGRVELQQLRENPDMLRNVKDLEYEKEKERENMKQEEKRKEEAKENEIERQRQTEERALEKKKREAKRKEEAKVKELERQRKGEERLQPDDNTNQNSLDTRSIAISGTAVLGLAIISSNLVRANKTEEVVNGAGNLRDIDMEDASSFNVTAPEVDPRVDNSSDILGANEIGGILDGGNNETDVNGESSLGSVALEDEAGNSEILIDDSLKVAEDSIHDGTLEGMFNVMDSPSLNSHSESDVEYDWEDDWLETIADIMHDANED